MPIFTQRYLFTGQLELTTGLHIGGGRATLASTDSPIVRTATDDPFIPGSSFKGAFRSTVEKLASAIPGIHTCALTGGNACIGPLGDEQRTFNQRRRDERWSESKIAAEAEKQLCDTCQLFGSPFFASKLLFSDLYLSQGQQAFTQIRDGVGIDRDSERAADGLKYDFEVVEANVAFRMQMTLDDPSERDLGLTCLGLAEFVAGFAGIGGKRSRGLGNCRMTDLRIFTLDLHGDHEQRVERLRRYLLGKNGHPSTAREPEDRLESIADADVFLAEHINRLLSTAQQ